METALSALSRLFAVYGCPPEARELVQALRKQMTTEQADHPEVLEVVGRLSNWLDEHDQEITQIINQSDEQKVGKDMALAICWLSDICTDFNQVAEVPNERGPDHYALALICHEDGSGMVAQFGYPINGNPLDNGHPIFEFKNPKEAREWFTENASLRSWGEMDI